MEREPINHEESRHSLIACVRLELPDLNSPDLVALSLRVGNGEEFVLSANSKSDEILGVYFAPENALFATHSLPIEAVAYDDDVCFIEAPQVGDYAPLMFLVQGEERRLFVLEKNPLEFTVNSLVRHSRTVPVIPDEVPVVKVSASIRETPLPIVDPTPKPASSSDVIPFEILQDFIQAGIKLEDLEKFSPQERTAICATTTNLAYRIVYARNVIGKRLDHEIAARKKSHAPTRHSISRKTSV